MNNEVKLLEDAVNDIDWLYQQGVQFNPDEKKLLVALSGYLSKLVESISQEA